MTLHRCRRAAAGRGGRACRQCRCADGQRGCNCASGEKIQVDTDGKCQRGAAGALGADSQRPAGGLAGWRCIRCERRLESPARLRPTTLLPSRSRSLRSVSSIAAARSRRWVYARYANVGQFSRQGGQSKSFAIAIGRTLDLDVSEYASLQLQAWVRIIDPGMPKAGDQGSESARLTVRITYQAKKFQRPRSEKVVIYLRLPQETAADLRRDQRGSEFIDTSKRPAVCGIR